MGSLTQVRGDVGQIVAKPSVLCCHLANTNEAIPPIAKSRRWLLVLCQAAVMLLKNGEMVTTVWAESVPSWATSSNVAVLHLSADDEVWLSLLSRAPYLHGYMYTTFSGFHVFDD